MVSNSNFIFLDKTMRINKYIDGIIVNFPKSESNLKKHIEDCMYKLIRFIHNYNACDTNKEKIRCIKSYNIELSMLDYFVGIGRDKKLINKKKFYTICRVINELRKIASSLMSKCNE